MDDLYFDPEIEDYSFTFSDLCKFKFIKNKAHIIQYTQNNIEQCLLHII